MNSKKKNILILGGGSWGTALAILLNKNGHKVSVWEFQKELADSICLTRENPDFLPGIIIPAEIEISSDLASLVPQKNVIVVVVPSHVVRSVMTQLTGFNLESVLIVSCSKGIENDTLMPVTDVIDEILSEVSADHIAALSGPSHAEEVARSVPTAVTIACKSDETAGKLQTIFMNSAFRVYTSRDVVGVEMGGALKNVIAVAAGILDGAGGGDNTKAALMTRGIVEITRLGTALGADPLTFAGLSGIGDLIVTCMSKHSRNRHLGEEIGKGKTLEQVMSEMVQVAEGMRTAKSVMNLSDKLEVSMPISTEVYKVLFEDKPAKKAMHDLMTRDAKHEDFG